MTDTRPDATGPDGPGPDGTGPDRSAAHAAGPPERSGPGGGRPATVAGGSQRDARLEQDYPGALLRVSAAYGWRLIVLGVIVYVAFKLVGRLHTVVIPFAIALLLTALLRPVLVFLRRRGVPRPLATLLTVVLAIVVVGGLIALVVARAVQQAPQLGDEINRVIPKVQHWLITGPLKLDRATVDNFGSTLTQKIAKNSSAIASTALSTGKTVLELLAGLVLTAFITVFLLYDGEAVWGFCTKAFPRTARPRVDTAGRAAWGTLTHYVRGTLVVAVFHGAVTAIALAVLGVPLVGPLALLVALGSFVPLIGTIVTGVVAVGVAAVAQGPVAGLVMAIVLVVDSQADAHLLQPFVVGRYVRIHPLAIVVALATGTILLGLFGAVIAVPLVGCVNSAVRAVTASPDVPDPPDQAGGHGPTP